MMNFSLPFLLVLIAGSMLMLSFVLASRMRLLSLLRFFALQSILLAAYAGTLSFVRAEWNLLVMAGLIVVLKGVIIPRFLMRVARESGASQRLESYARPTTLLFCSGIVSILSFIAAGALTSVVGSGYFITAVSFSLLSVGFLMLVSRKDLFGQIIGFLVMENGIFTFGLALTGGLALLIEVGILFDVVVGFALMTILLNWVQKQHASARTDLLRELTD